METPQFSFKVSISDNGIPVVKVGGEFDWSACPRFDQLIEPLLAAAPASIVFDVSEVEFMDSEGLKALIRCYRRLREEGGNRKVALAQPPRCVSRMVELLHLGELLPTFSSLEHALHGV